VLLLSRNDAYGYLSKFVVAEIPTTIRLIPVEGRMGSREGLPSPCVSQTWTTCAPRLGRGSIPALVRSHHRATEK
jgi:hypothetical protein